MSKIKILYITALGLFIISFFISPKTLQIDQNFLILLLITVAIPLPVIPIFMLSKSQNYYNKAEKEGRVRGPIERKPSTVEEEYRSDSIVMALLLIFLYIVCTISLWI